MSNVQDVAAYILETHGPMSTWKLQKLVYYSQGWHLAWDEVPLFPDRIEAWANGPVTRSLYSKHRGQFQVSAWPWGNSSNLRQNERETVDAVLRGYGSLSGRQLSHLTHQEPPWNDARGDLSPTAASNAEISQQSMQEFFMALDADPDASAIEDIDWS